MILRRLSIAAATAGLLAGGSIISAPRGAHAVTLPKLPKTVEIIDGVPGVCSSLFCYHPATLTVSRGTQVTWLNTSVAPHTVTESAGPVGGPNSGVINQAGRYAFKFTQDGTYTYFCTIHGFAVMHATVVVTG